MIKINKNMRSEYLKKFLIVYTILVGLFIGVYGFAFSNSTKTDAASEVVNLCGGGTSGPSNCNEGGSLPFGCYGNGASSYCTAGSGYDVWIFRCSDASGNECNQNGQNAGSSTVSNDTSVCLVQIDVFNAGQGPSTGIRDFVVIRNSEACDNGNPDGECTGNDCEPEEEKAVCGESCNEDSDCVNANAQGGDVECRNGMCQLDESVCPDGQTEPGAACECNFEGRTCGQRCGGSFGQCADGFRCVYADGPVCQFNEQLFCVPQDGDLPANYNITSCEDGQGDEWGQYVENTQTGKVSYTQQELAALCEDTPTDARCNELCGASANGLECAGGLACTETNTGEFKCRRASNPGSNTCERPEPGVCNERCGASANGRTCSDGLTCTMTASGVNKCRLAENPTSNLCQQQPGVCNDLCGASADGRTCSGNLACTQVANGSNRCRRASNPTSNTCEQTPGPCNALCGASANGRTCSNGFSCTLLASGSRRCRLDSNPTSNTCQPQQQTHLECVNQACTEVSGDGEDTCATDNDCEEVEEITCYRCTTNTTDGNTCQSRDFERTTCPTGWSTNSNCSQAVGGVCPAGDNYVDCYQCSASLADGNSCDHIQVIGDSCPANWTTNSACQTAASGGVCPVQDTNPNYSLLKVAENDDDGDKTFAVGDNIHFTVTIRNTGDVEISELTFVDNYDQVRLGLINNQIVGSVTKKNSDGSTVSTINNINNIITSSQVGSFTIQDLTTGLGTLLPGQYYEIKLTFFAKAPGVATNYAITQNTTTKDNEELPNKQSQDSVTIINLDTDK